MRTWPRVILWLGIFYYPIAMFGLKAPVIDPVATWTWFFTSVILLAWLAFN